MIATDKTYLHEEEILGHELDVPAWRRNFRSWIRMDIRNRPNREPVSLNVIEGWFRAINEDQFVGGNYDQGDEETYEGEDSKSNPDERYHHTIHRPHT